MPLFRIVDPVAFTTLQGYENRQLLHRARRYIYIKGAVNVVIAFLFLFTFPLGLRPRMMAIALADALLLVPYWFLVQRYPVLATGLSLGMTALAISAGDWVGGYQTGASGILYALLILGGHLILIKPLRTYLISGLVITVYAGTIALEVKGVIPIHFPFTMSNLLRVLSLNVISMCGLTVLTGVVTRLYRQLLQRNKELLALNAVSAAVSQSLNLDEVLQLALDKTLEATGVESGGILLLDPSGDKLVLETYWGGSPELTRTVSEAQADEGLMPRMLESVLVVNDFSELTRDRRVAIEKEGLQVMASAPLKSKDATLGVMVITSHSPHTFSSQDLGLLSAIGNQVGLAIERARLYEREQKRAVQLAVVNQVARRAASILDMDRLLPEVVAAVQQGFQYHNVALSLLDEAAGELDMLAIAGGFEDLVSSDYRQSVGEGMVGWVAETGQTLLANDVSQEPRYILGFLEEPLAQSELCVPLKLAGKVIGVLDIQCIQLNAFDETDLLAMETLAEQIVMAIENARLFEETKRRIKELTALYQNSLEITTQLEVSELLKSILERAVTLLKAEGGGICVYDPEREELRLAIGYGHTEEYVGITVKPGEGMAGKVFQIGEPLIVDDYRTWECKAPICEDDPPSIAVLQAPLKWQDRIMGVLSISAGAQRGPFDQDDVWLATLFANQVAVAIENARLYQQTDEKLQTRVRELAALYAIAEVVNHSDLDAVLQLALNSAIRLTGMDSGGILLLDPSTNELFLRANRGWSPEFIQAVRHTKANEGLMPRLLESTLVIDDLSELTKERRIAIEKESFQSLVSIPLKAQESALGVMGVTSYSPRTVASEELDLLATIGNQVGMAVDRANLQTQELRAAVLEERQDMARQMHDDIAQTLGYLGLQVDNVMDSPSLAQSAKVQAELEEIRRAIEGAYERVRSSITRLREDVPDYLDLGIALPKIINKFEKRTGCKVELRVDEGQLSCLSPLVALQATYIIREALANIRKHSGADSVYLAIRGLEDGLTEVTIRDNGRGFDLDSERRSGSGGYGLRFMRERAERVRGSLKVESQPGQGTRLVVRLPPR